MIEFRQTTDYASDYTTISTGEENLEAICDTFQRFLLAVGFTLPEGAHIGYEYDEDYVPPSTDCGTDSGNTLPNGDAENDRLLGKFCRCGGNQTTGRDMSTDCQPDDVADCNHPEEEAFDAIVGRLHKRVAELESWVNRHDSAKPHSTIVQNPSTNPLQSADSGEEVQTSRNTTPEEVVEALYHEPYMGRVGRTLAAAVRELARGYKEIHDLGEDIARAVMEMEQ